MPIFTAVAAAVSAFAATTVGGYVVQAVVGYAVSYAVSTLFAAEEVPAEKAKEDGGYAYVSGSIDVAKQLGSKQQLGPATTNKLSVAYGNSLIKPIIIDAKISSDQQTMWYVCAICEAPEPGNSISFLHPGPPTRNNQYRPLVYWGDKRMEFRENDYTTVARLVDDYNGGQEDNKYDGKMQVWLYNNGSTSGQFGAPSAASILDSTAIDPDSIRWTNNTDYAMYKCAFAIVKVKYDQEIGLTGLQELSFYVSNTIKTPGNVLYDYLTNTRYGCGLPTKFVDSASLAKLNTYSAKTINYTKTNQAGVVTNVSGPRFEIHGAVDTTKTCWDNLQLIAKCCDSWIRWNETTAKWGVVINQSISQAGLGYGNLPIILCDTHYEDYGSGNLSQFKVMHAVGSLDIQPIDLNSTFNKAEVQYVNKDIRWTTSMEYLSINPTLLSANEPENELKISLPFATNPGQALFIAKRKLAQSREDLVITVKIEHSGIQIEAGDIVRIYHKQYGWTNADGFVWGKLFRVNEVREEKSDDGSLGVQISCFEYNDDIYEQFDLNAFQPEENTALRNPNIIDPPTLISITESNEAVIVPYFNLNCIVSSSGITNAIEVWYYEGISGLSAATLETVQFKLLMTQQPKLTPVYDKGETIAIMISTLPANQEGLTYYMKARAVGTLKKSLYSSEILNFRWQPIGIADNTSGTVPGALSLFWNHDFITASGTGTHSYINLYSVALPTLNAEAPAVEEITYDVNLTNWTGTTAFTRQSGTGTETTRLAVLYKVDSWTKIPNWDTQQGMYWTTSTVSKNGAVAFRAGKFGSTDVAFGTWYLEKSVNNGATWEVLTGAGLKQWGPIAMSADGQKIFAITYNPIPSTDKHYRRSLDGGVTWTQHAVADSYALGSIACSDDGTKVFITGSDNYGGVFTSSDSGLTWTRRTPFGTPWGKIRCNSTGTILYATSDAQDRLQKSIDGGLNWTNLVNAPNNFYDQYAISSDAKHLIAVQSLGESGSQLYTSSDFGVTWTYRAAAGTRLWSSAVWVSDDGLTMYACADYLYQSKNGGISWTVRPSSTNHSWQFLMCDNTTKTIMIGAAGGNMYRNTALPNTYAGLEDWQILYEVNPTVASWTYVATATSGELAVGNASVVTELTIPKKDTPSFSVAMVSKTGANTLDTQNTVTMAASPVKTASIKRRAV